MEYKVKKNNNATADLKITFTAKDIEFGFKKAYEKARPKVKINGFRQGKAPIEMVEKILGDSVTEDAVNILIQDAMNEILPKLDPGPFQVPSFKVDEFNKQKTLIVSTTYYTESEVTLNKYKKMKFDERKIHITDEDIANDFKQIQKNMMKSILKEANEPSEKTDIVEFEYSFEPASGKEKFPLRGSYQIGGEYQFPEFDSNLTGVTPGQKLEISRTFEIKNENEEKDSKSTILYKIEVKNILKTIIPELSDELISEWNGSPTTLAEYKEKLKKELSSIVQRGLKEKSIESLIEKIVQESKFVIPKVLIETIADENFHYKLHDTNLPHLSMKEYSEKMGESFDQVQKVFFEGAERTIKEWVSLTKIAEEEKIEVTDDDLAELAKTQSQSLENFLKMLKKDGRENLVRKNLLLKKVHDFLYDISEKKTGSEITYSEFVQLANKSKEGAN